MFFATGIALVVFACTPKATPAATSRVATPAIPVISATAATPAAPAKPTASGADIVAGHAVYDTKCSGCHALKETGSYTAREWDPILASMAPKARLSAEETEQVRAYLKANSKATK